MMIPERSGVALDSTVTGEDVEMAIDQSAVIHLMGVLTDLYSDPERAVIREYATNAIDAHVEAGESRPIEVTTPSDLRPVFTVRDFGPGLSAEDIRAIYSRYGASTKRGSNDVVGMLGLGCKSALAYVDQFSLVGVKDGARVAVSVTRDERGAGTMTILESGDTDEPSGVEVSVPAKRDNRFADKAAEFFSYWAPGTVLVDGEAPGRVMGYELTPDLIVTERLPADERMIVVMGNVPYPVDVDEMGAGELDLPRNRALVARVPIGSVQFAPSREALQNTAATRRTLAGIGADYRKQAALALQRDVDAATSRAEAVQAFHAANEALGPKKPEAQFQGEPVPLEIRPAADATIWHAGGTRRYSRGESDRIIARSVPISLAARAVWVLGFDNATWTPTMRRKLNRYLEHHKMTEDGPTEDVLMTTAATIPGDRWLAGSRQVTWETVRAWKDPEATSASAMTPSYRSFAGTYPVHTPGGSLQHKFPAESLTGGRTIYYSVGNKWGGTKMAVRFAEAGVKCYLVMLTATRAEKFKRLFPDASPAEDALKSIGKDWWNGLPTTTREAVGMFGISSQRNYDLPLLQALDPARIDDPELSHMAKLAAAYTDDVRSAYMANRFDLPKDIKAARGFTVGDRYPLLTYARHDRTKERDHVYFYVNAAFAANQQEAR